MNAIVIFLFYFLYRLYVCSNLTNITFNDSELMNIDETTTQHSFSVTQFNESFLNYTTKGQFSFTSFQTTASTSTDVDPNFYQNSTKSSISNILNTSSISSSSSFSISSSILSSSSISNSSKILSSSSTSVFNFIERKNEFSNDCDFDVNKKILTCSKLNLTQSWFSRYIEPNAIESVKIDLSHNNISELNEYSFGKFLFLKNIDLSFNKIVHIDKFAWYIIDKRNDTTSWPSYVDKINLSNNKLEIIFWYSFSMLSNLTSLNFSKNLLQSFENFDLIDTTGCHCLFRSLKFLDVSHNLITVVDSRIMKYLTNLVFVNLSNNFIRRIEPSFRYNVLVYSKQNELTINLQRNSIDKKDCNAIYSEQDYFQPEIITAMKNKYIFVYFQNKNLTIHYIVNLDSSCMSIKNIIIFVIFTLLILFLIIAFTFAFLFFYIFMFQEKMFKNIF